MNELIGGLLMLLYWFGCLSVGVALIFFCLYIVYKVIAAILSWMFSIPYFEDEPQKPTGRFFTPPLNPIINQEDSALQESRKRINKAFNQQQAEMNARALKAHDAGCADTWACTSDQCFVVEGDKIVATSTEKRKTDDERRKTAKNGEVKIKANLNRLKYGMDTTKK